MGVLSFLLRALFVLIFVRLLGLVLRALFRGFRAGIADPPAASTGGATRASGAAGSVEEMRRDPVCGVHVAASAAVPGVYRGEPAFFCSRECALRAEAKSA